MDSDDNSSPRKVKEPVKKDIPINNKKKRIVVNLDSDKICSVEGLPRLKKEMENNEWIFQNKINIENFDRFIHVYKRWAHRLIPSLTFEDFLLKIDELSNKKQIHIKLFKMREEESSNSLPTNGHSYSLELSE